MLTMVGKAQFEVRINQKLVKVLEMKIQNTIWINPLARSYSCQIKMDLNDNFDFPPKNCYLKWKHEKIHQKEVHLGVNISCSEETSLPQKKTSL